MSSIKRRIDRNQSVRAKSKQERIDALTLDELMFGSLEPPRRSEQYQDLVQERAALIERFRKQLSDYGETNARKLWRYFVDAAAEYDPKAHGTSVVMSLVADVAALREVELEERERCQSVGAMMRGR